MKYLAFTKEENELKVPQYEFHLTVIIFLLFLSYTPFLFLSYTLTTNSLGKELRFYSFQLHLAHVCCT